MMTDEGKLMKRPVQGMDRRLRDYVAERRDERRPLLDVEAFFHSGVGYMEKQLFAALDASYQSGRRFLFTDGAPPGEVRRSPELQALVNLVADEQARKDTLIRMLRHSDELAVDLINNPAALLDHAPTGIGAVEALWLLYPDLRLFGLDDPTMVQEQRRVIEAEGAGRASFHEVARLRGRLMFEELIRRTDELSDRGRTPLQVILAATMIHFAPFYDMAQLRDMRWSPRAIR
jgi:hypothetical protein